MRNNKIDKSNSVQVKPEIKLEGEATFLFGKIVGLHGLQGTVKVRPETNSPEILENVIHLRTAPDKFGESMDLKISKSVFDKRLYFLNFEGFDTRTEVEPLYGASLYAWSSELTKLADEEFWVKDLVGMTAYTLEGKLIGKIKDIIYGGGDLLEIQSEDDPLGKTILIPFVKDIVPVVDIEKKEIKIKEIPGLFEAQ